MCRPPGWHTSCFRHITIFEGQTFLILDSTKWLKSWIFSQKNNKQKSVSSLRTTCVVLEDDTLLVWGTLLSLGATFRILYSYKVTKQQKCINKKLSFLEDYLCCPQGRHVLSSRTKCVVRDGARRRLGGSTRAPRQLSRPPWSSCGSKRPKTATLRPFWRLVQSSFFDLAPSQCVVLEDDTLIVRLHKQKLWYW